MIKQWFRYFIGKMSDKEKIKFLMLRAEKPMLDYGMLDRDGFEDLVSVSLWHNTGDNPRFEIENILAARKIMIR